MVKWFISLLAVAALVNAGYTGSQPQPAAEAPVLPKNAAPAMYQPQQGFVPQPPVAQQPPQQPQYAQQAQQSPQLPQPAAPQPQKPYANVQQTPARPSFDCLSKADGFYELGRCQNNYVQCLYGEASSNFCPTNLVFDKDRCNYINDCLNPTQPPPLQQQPPAQPQVYAPATKTETYVPMPEQQPAVSGYARQQQFRKYNNKQQQTIQKTPPKPAETYCQDRNLIEGYHAPGCSAEYFACSPISTIRISCPSGLFYDNEMNQCDYKHSIPICGGKRPAPTAQSPPANQYGTPQQQIQSYALAPAPQQQPPAPQPQSYAPAPQQQPPAPQPQSYAPAPAPQQQPPAPQAQSYAPAPAPQPQTYAYSPIQQTPPKPAETFCLDRNLDDGFHGKGCSPHFYVCAQTQTTKLECPIGLFWDQDTNECAHKESVVMCGGRKPPPAAQQPQSSPYGRPLARQPPPPPPPEFDCTSRTDGIYVRGCNKAYFVCIQEKTMPLSCPSGLYYSAFTEMCDYKANVVECGGTAPTKQPIAQNPVMIPPPQSPYGRAPEQPAHQQPIAPQSSYTQTQTPSLQALAKSNNPCATLSNGIYGRKCSRFFFTCIQRKTYDFICPKDQAFNLATVKCAPKVEISTCPEFAAPAPALQQQQPKTQQPLQQSYALPASAQQPTQPAAPHAHQTYVPPPQQPLQQQQQPAVPKAGSQQYL